MKKRRDKMAVETNSKMVLDFNVDNRSGRRDAGKWNTVVGFEIDEMSFFF
jgi:hypothetical protein